MEAAIGAASGLISSVVNLLSNELVEAYVASAELGLNSTKVKDDLMFTQGLLHEAQTRGVSNNAGLEGLLWRLRAKADEAEDVLDELHYFIIQDQLDGTHYAVPDLGDDLRGHARHGRHALRHTVGNCLACFSCSCMQQDHDEAAASADVVTHKSRNAGPADKLSFDRVAMSKKIKLVLEQILPLCDRVSELLKINPPHANNTAIGSLKRPLIGSTTTQDTLYGRRDLFEKTIKDIITSAGNSCEKLSVLPLVGPGGIGKTTFSQHLYNDKRIKEHFSVRVWICVSIDFDVLKLSQQILSCIERSNNANQTTSLDQIQISIAENIKSKRFLIVFDDIWECNREDWENLLAPFMKGEAAQGSMVLVTTRFPSIAEMVKSTNPLYLKGLEDDDFFTFFEALIFDGEKPEDCQLELTNVARNIAKKLKGSPLAAKTVGRLLRKDLSREHWIGVLENNKWQKQESPSDIMASLRISYDYLPLHLRKSFPYFALFPEDYRFRNLEITHFWIAIGIINEDENYMEELVDYGFLVKGNDYLGQHYVIHDLLHELSQIVSSQESLNINRVSFKADVVPKSIRHISITMEDRHEENFRGEMVKLRSKIDTVNLRALMIFRAYGEPIGEILKDTFKEIEGLRVLLVEVKSVESLVHNFSKLIHLRFLKIRTPKYDPEVTLPSTLSRFYHLILLDVSSWHPSTKLPKDISRLISLRHFAARKELHSNVPAVGKMKCLKELTEFCVKKESDGFELSELGALAELGGELRICNLESVATKEEALKAKLVSKGGLKKLTLVWGGDQQAAKSDVLDGLEPHPNLQALCIENHGGSTGPSWLCGKFSLMMLTSLRLEGVSWVDPPFGHLLQLRSLTLKNISRLGQIRPGSGDVTDRSFMLLKHIILLNLPRFSEWVRSPDAQTFSGLEEIRCGSCPNLCSLPFLQECSGVSYNHLHTLEIKSCPMLFLPPMPHTSTLTEVEVKDSPAGEMQYDGNRMNLIGYSSALAWHNMAGKVERISFGGGSITQWAEIPKVTFLREVTIKEDPSFLSMALLSNLPTSLTSLVLLDCENLTVDGFNPLIAAVNLKVLAVYNTGRDGPRSVAADLLSELVVASSTKLLLPAAGCFRLEALFVDCISAMLAAPVCSLFATTLHKLHFSYDQRVEIFTEEEEDALQLLTSLQTLYFWECRCLPSLPQGVHSLSSLTELYVHDCPEIRSLPKGGLPTSLRLLRLWGCPEIRSLPAEGLPTSLRELYVFNCSPELHEQAKEFEGTKPDLYVGC